MPRWTRHVLVFIASWALLACGSNAPPWCGGDGAEAVIADEPTGWREPPELALAWRLDGHAAGQELVLPSSAAISEAANRLAVVDFELGEVIVTTLDGEWVGRWGRRGEGPGEIGYAVAARWTPGPMLEVYDPPNSKIVGFDSMGAVVGERRVDREFAGVLGGGVVWLALGGAGSLLAQPIVLPREDAASAEMVVLRADSAGSALDTIARATVPVVNVRGWAPVTAPGHVLPFAAESPNGELAIAGEGPEYRVMLRARDGRRTHLCRTVSAQPLEDAESTPAEGADAAWRAALLGAPKPDVPGAVSRVSYDAAGRLWVQRDRPRVLDAADAAVGREGALYDVYSGTTLLGEVRLPERVRLLAATRELLIGVHRDSLDVYSIVAYRPGW